MKSASPCPTTSSFPYTEAQSMWRYPTAHRMEAEAKLRFSSGGLDTGGLRHNACSVDVGQRGWAGDSSV
jgi:hypothetical protein